MELIDVIWDLCFLFGGLGSSVFVLIKRKNFDLWLSLLICGACICKGFRHLFYDWSILSIRKVETIDAFQLLLKTHVVLGVMDTLVFVLICGALLRLVILGLYSRWYKKAVKFSE